MGEPITKERLRSFIFLRREVENQMERLARMKNNELIPALKESDGSKHSSGASDRMANAIIKRITFEDSISEELESKLEEMEEIKNAVDGLCDSQEREVLRLRYIDGTGYKHMPWRDISMNLYGNDDEKHVQATYRLHGRALESVCK